MERGAGQPRLVWNRSTTQCWFHYTEPSLAVQIAREKVYVVSQRPHQTHGHGLFVTNRQPGELADHALLVELFALQRSPEAVEGVVVLLRDQARLSFTHVAPHSWFHAAAAESVIDLSFVLVGTGVRIGGVWHYSLGLAT